MIEASRIYASISLSLLTLVLIFHIVAMAYPRWKIHEHRHMDNKTLTVGIFHRCENRLLDVTSNTTKVYSVCDDNTYNFHPNTNCIGLTNPTPTDNVHLPCHWTNNPYRCHYSSYGRGLMACTIIAACTLGLAFLLLFAHILINPYKYRIHFCIAVPTIILLLLGFIFILITLILLGSTLSYDLFQYRYNLDCRTTKLNDQAEKDAVRNNVTRQAKEEYHTRHDWATGLEIIALVLTSFTIITQLIYLISVYRNRNG